ncbi:hypothetical protein HYPSUDRAFT_48395 [Hypholoma sublateritium FD-334 SS-4]|uniref:Uncharacterized protein n=1 Tax=Hypholoma sublateritium (strain FD-334 SS-4) TaxID=945553 RepID=A0A0D2LX58_HYPSF|nr:hypothetical protein HYPSUDRAFT_48395 [Hypholoma sublateritium FD-334 SS-4]
MQTAALPPAPFGSDHDQQDGLPSYQSPSSQIGTQAEWSRFSDSIPRGKLRKPQSRAEVDIPRTEVTRPFDEQSTASSEGRQNPLIQVGRGVLMILATPLAIAGMGVYAAGMMLEGGAMILKGVGSVGRLPLASVRTSLKGKKKGPSRKMSLSTAPHASMLWT